MEALVRKLLVDRQKKLNFSIKAEQFSGFQTLKFEDALLESWADSRFIGKDNLITFFQDKSIMELVINGSPSIAPFQHKCSKH